MSSLVSLFLCMTLIYFSYSAISYKVVLAYMGEMFLCSSFVHDLEACVLHEHPFDLVAQFISSHIHLYTCSSIRIKWIFMHVCLDQSDIRDSF